MTGHFSKQIRRMQEQFKRSTDRKAKVSRGRTVVPKHEALTEQCELCGKNHSPNQHRFHGEGSHLRTHGDEAEGQRRYVSEMSLGPRKASKAITGIQKQLAKIMTPRGPVKRKVAIGGRKA